MVRSQGSWHREEAYFQEQDSGSAVVGLELEPGRGEQARLLAAVESVGVVLLHPLSLRKIGLLGEYHRAVRALGSSSVHDETWLVGEGGLISHSGTGHDFKDPISTAPTLNAVWSSPNHNGLVAVGERSALVILLRGRDPQETTDGVVAADWLGYFYQGFDLCL